MKQSSTENPTRKTNKCYVCKQPTQTTHEHYSLMCVSCGDYNYEKKIAIHDLSSYTALVTGGRTKIGYFTALRLLRDGARVIVTSRFPYDTLQHYIQESDFESWKDRIHIYGLDFRQIERVEQFATFLDQQFPSIDIIINNAAQTVRMPEEEYLALATQEQTLQQQLAGNELLAITSSMPNTDFAQKENHEPSTQALQPFQNEFAIAKQNSSQHNAWIAQSHQISLYEMLEVQLINVTAPFLLNTKLKPLMLRSSNPNRFIVNVSSAEGKFNIKRKGRYHVHTNMAKASLNMMTLTLSKEYKKHRIFVTSVDPGWVSNQYPQQLIEKTPMKLPLDFEDAAARILDPVYEGITQERPWTGILLKDYQPVDW